MFALDGAIDYRRRLIHGLKVYLTPLGPETDAAMDEDWFKLTGKRTQELAMLIGSRPRAVCAVRSEGRGALLVLTIPAQKPLAAASTISRSRAHITTRS